MSWLLQVVSWSRKWQCVCVLLLLALLPFLAELTGKGLWVISRLGLPARKNWWWRYDSIAQFCSLILPVYSGFMLDGSVPQIELWLLATIYSHSASGPIVADPGSASGATEERPTPLFSSCSSPITRRRPWAPLWTFLCMLSASALKSALHKKWETLVPFDRFPWFNKYS